MHLHPAVTEEEVMRWLLAQAVAPVGSRATDEELAEALQPIAAAMAAISAVVMPDEVEPLFP